MESAQHQARQMSARLASSQLVAQNAEANCSQQTVAAASAEHNAQKLERKVVDLQWEVEQTQQQLRSKAHHAEHKLKVLYNAHNMPTFQQSSIHTKSQHRDARKSQIVQVP